MNSIRKKLLISILSVIAFVTLVLAIATYFSVREEMFEVYDENMKQIAIVLARTGLEDEKVSMQYASTRDKLDGEEEFLIQIWRGGILKYTSHPAIDFPLQNHPDGDGSAIHKDKKWHFYRLRHDEDVIQIAQDLHQRHYVIAEISHVLIVPIIIQFPLLALLIWILVGYGLQPLNRISDLIKKRTASFLKPLPEENVPVEISSLVHALNDLLSRLQTALEIQRRFTADAAHELRSPLTAIRLQLDLLQRAGSNTEKTEAINALEKGVNRSIRLVQQLLELARQEPENAETPFTSVELAAIIQEQVDHALPISQAKHIALTTDLKTPTHIMGNSAKLSVMIGNLINNAITYTQDGGKIQITLIEQSAMIVLDVSDNGIGIKSDDRQRIFDRFFRVAGTGAIGSGLGLSIVKTVAELHDIQINVLDGIDGKGTTFRLITPVLR